MRKRHCDVRESRGSGARYCREHEQYICSNCGHHEPIFGTGGAEKLAEKYHTQLLGQMPLHISLREDLDKGTPTVISRPESEFTAIYRQLADRVAAQLYWQGEVIPGEISFRAV